MDAEHIIMSLWHERGALPTILNELKLTGQRGAEVGTQRGHFAQTIRSVWRGIRLHCVDPWQNLSAYADTGNVSDAQHMAFMKEAHNRLDGVSQHPYKFVLHQCTSLDMARSYTAAGEDGTFEFVYIDADHSYASVKADLEAWFPLVKPGGVMAGHDYILDGWHADDDPFTAFPTPFENIKMSDFGVRRAVDEFFAAKGLRVYLTSPGTDGGYQSWLVQK